MPGGAGAKAPVPRYTTAAAGSPQSAAASSAASAATPAAAAASPSDGGAGLRMMQKSASAASTFAHRRADSGLGAAAGYGRSESPANNLRVLPSLAKGKVSTPESRWRKLKAPPAGSPTSNSIAALSRTGAGPGMSYSSSLASLKGSPAAAALSAGSNASLARAYGASAVAATAAGSRENLFTVVMAAKKIRTAQGGMKTVIGGPGHVGASGSMPLASIQSGKGVPSSLGQFSLQGVSATISPQPAEDDPASPLMKRRALHSRGGMRGSTGGSMSGAALSPAAIAAGSPSAAAQARARQVVTPTPSSQQHDSYESGPEAASAVLVSRSKAQLHPQYPQSAASASTSPEPAGGGRRMLKSKGSSSSNLGASTSTPSAPSRTLAGAHIHSEEDDAAYLANLDR